MFQLCTGGLHWSGDSVDLLSGTICTTVVVSDWYIMNLVQGWLVLIWSIILLALLEEETVPSAVLGDYQDTEDNNGTLYNY